MKISKQASKQAREWKEWGKEKKRKEKKRKEKKRKEKKRKEEKKKTLNLVCPISWNRVGIHPIDSCL